MKWTWLDKCCAGGEGTGHCWSCAGGDGTGQCCWMGPATPQFSGLSVCFHGGLVVWKPGISELSISCIFLSIFLSVCLPVYLFTHLIYPINLTIRPSIYLTYLIDGFYNSIYNRIYMKMKQGKQTIFLEPNSRVVWSCTLTDAGFTEFIPWYSMQVSCSLHAGFADLAYWCVTSMRVKKQSGP